MSKVERHFNKGYFIVAATAIVYLAFIMISDTQTLAKSFERIRWEYIGLLLLVEFGVLVLRTARNRIFLSSLGINISFKRNLLIYFAGLALTISPGSVGEMVRSQFLKREVGKPVASTIPIYFAERLNDLIAVTVLTSIFLVFVDFVEGKIVVIISVIIIIFMYAIFKNRRLFMFLTSKTKSIKFVQKFSQNIDQLHESSQSIFSWKVVRKTLPASIPIWLMHGLTAYLTFLAFRVDLGFMQTFVIYFTSLVIGVMSFIPAGVGVTETSLVGLLTLRGINFSVAVAMTLVLRFVTIWLAAIIGIFASKLLFSKQVPTSEDESK